MHIPDGLISINQAIVYWIISIVILAIFFLRISKKVDMSKRSLLTAFFTTAFIVATSITVPSPLGVPMHFFLIPLVVIILGPLNASLVAFLGLLIQALLLGMGGITTLGANVLDMGIVLSLVVYGIYTLFFNIDYRLAIFISTISGILAASVAQIIILSLTNTTSLEVLLGSLLPYYLMVGIIEGVFNIIVLEFLSRLRGDILEIEKVWGVNLKRVLLVLILFFVLALSVSSTSAHGADLTEDTMIIANESNGILAKKIVDDLGLNITVYKFESEGDVEHQLEHAITNPNKRILAIAYQDTVNGYLENHSELKNRVIVSDDDNASIGENAQNLISIDVSNQKDDFTTPLVVGLIIGCVIGLIGGVFILRFKS